MIKSGAVEITKKKNRGINYFSVFDSLTSFIEFL